MNMIMAKFQRFEKIRRFHTIIKSQETIKPSSPTPPPHNLSIIDQMAPNVHMPWILFYKNYNNGDTNILKKSLSKCLSQYYPFAGRLVTSHINYNDAGVEFLEACIDVPLDDFVVKRDPDETINQLIPNALGCAFNKNSPNMLEVQLNHFPCGGVAVAVSISHKVADAFTMANFINHWATVTRGGSPINPSFVSSPIRNTDYVPDYFAVEGPSKNKYVERRFVFLNSKLSELKNKINAMGGGSTPLNPSRVESLTSLLFKCAVGAATTISGSLQPSVLSQAVNMRDKISTTICPKSIAAGNIASAVSAKIVDSSQIELNEVIKSLRIERMKIQGVKEFEQVAEMLTKQLSTMTLAKDPSHRNYFSSSMCRFPVYQVDFGWGKPARVVLLTSCHLESSHFIFMDTASGDGIEAIVQLEEEEMAVFQNDKQLLAYVEDMMIN